MDIHVYVHLCYDTAENCGTGMYSGLSYPKLDILCYGKCTMWPDKCKS